MAGRLLVILMAIAVAGVSFAASRDDEQPESPAAPKSTATAPPSGALRIDLLYSPEKSRLIPPLAESFNAAHMKVGGRVVVVDAHEANSGDVEDGIAHGRLQPVAWSPASSLWGQLLNYETDKPYASRSSPSIVRSPLVIAMWEPMARALGWPRKPIGFGDLLRL